ncbi:GntR family transcriptional regulator [Mesorhizobium sp. M0659]|uniref:GntR family transcriptional regulator n=1 Tax=Mesorhizobium sp. M0659 TaxID=2956980 RepID=UPI00333B18F4
MKSKAGSIDARLGKPQSLALQAYEAIKERIITLHFLPGQYVNEADIAAYLHFGRTPVHQALQRLDHEGLVQVLPRKGIIIRPDSLQEILRILDSRITVEPELARLAAQLASGEQAMALLNLASVTDATPGSPDIAAFTIDDRAFHRMIGDMSGNPVMADFGRMLHERSTRFWYLHLWQTINVELSNRQHLKVATAIAAGDGAVAVETMSEHIGALRERLKKLPGSVFGAPSAFAPRIGN